MEAKPTFSADKEQPLIEPDPAQTSDALLGRIVADSVQDKTTSETNHLLDRFLRADLPEALRLWFRGKVPASQDEIGRRLNYAVAQIDRLLNDQLNTVLHHPEFQKLESSWRGLDYLVNCVDAEGDRAIVIRALNTGWRELQRDFDRATEFDRSSLFQKLYTEEFGQPGGRPYGLLIADYDVHPYPTASHPHEDVRLLQSLSHVGAAAFCPVVLNASPAMFGMDSFERMQQRLDHQKTFDQRSYLAWNSFRETEDARFIALAMPHVLMRTPYEDDGTRIDEFQFQEDVRGPDRSKYLWGGAAFAMGEVVIRAFAESGWPANIRGLHRGYEGGGLVTQLPSHHFGTDRQGLAVRSSTDVIVTEELERQLTELGFIPLCHCTGTEHSVFFSNLSVQKPKKYDRRIATINAQISAMLQYMLCVSRFAHYVKVIGRDRTGGFTSPSELERELHQWLAKYVTADAEASPEVKSRHPLREAKVRVQPKPGAPGSLDCVMHLAPHYELDELTASVRIVAELRSAVTK